MGFGFAVVGFALTGREPDVMKLPVGRQCPLQPGVLVSGADEWRARRCMRRRRDWTEFELRVLPCHIGTRTIWRYLSSQTVLSCRRP
jgi:hypothetical protein